MENVEINYDLINISDIFDEKVQINSLFHFSLIQKIIEEFIKRQNLMNQKLNALEIKFDSWSLTHDVGGDTENNNKTETKNEIIKDEFNNKESEQNKKDEFNQLFEGSFKELNKKIKKLELINKEMAQRLVVNNNQNSENISKFIETSEDKINQIYSNFKNMENKVNQNERVINNQTNKLNQLMKIIETFESDIEENKKKIKNINSDLFDLKRLKMEDLVNEFYRFKNQNEKSLKNIKNLIEEKITKFKNDLFGKNAKNLDEPNANIDITSSINEFQIKDMANELKTYFHKNILENNKNIQKSINELNIPKINQDISNIQKELKEKLTQKNLTELNIKMEDFENKLLDFKSQNSENIHTLEYYKEHISKIDKNIEFFSMQINRLNQNEKEKEKKENDLINNESIKLLVKKDSYEEDMTKIFKRMEKIFVFQQENMNKIDTIEKKLKLFPTDKDIKNIEHYALNMIQEFKIIATKKFLDKKEAIKTIKLLGLQIKNINEYLNLNNPNISSDRILANNPMNNYCPSCDKKISNQNRVNINEYSSNRNKDKSELKNYRMGQGFSHMLQLINSDLMKSAEKISDDSYNKIDENVNYNFNEKDNRNKNINDNKPLPRLISQKSFSILNAEAKSNNDLDTSNNNISAHYINDNSFRTVKNNSIDKLLNDKSDIKNKIFKKMERTSPWKNNTSTQPIYTKVKKIK